MSPQGVQTSQGLEKASADSAAVTPKMVNRFLNSLEGFFKNLRAGDLQKNIQAEIRTGLDDIAEAVKENPMRAVVAAVGIGAGIAVLGKKDIVRGISFCLVTLASHAFTELNKNMEERGQEGLFSNKKKSEINLLH